MDNTIKALAEIEERAQVILDRAYLTQQEMSQKHTKDLESLKLQIKSETEQKIEDLKKKLKSELADKIESTKKDNATVINKIDETYRQNHEKIVQKIFNNITAL